MTTEQILTQVEFYLSDANLSRDEFLSKKLSESEEQWISIPLLASFKRMQSLTTDTQVIVDALRVSQKLQVDEEGTRVRRIVSFDPEQARTGRDECIVRVTNLPKDATLDELIQFFKEQAPVALVRRKMNGEAFGGLAWVEFESKEGAERVAAMTELTMKDRPLKCLLKNQLKASYTIKPNSVLHMSWQGQVEGDVKEMIHAQLKTFELPEARSIHVEPSTSEAVICFSEENEASQAVTKLSGPLLGESIDVQLKVLGDEDAQAFMKRIKPKKRDRDEDAAQKETKEFLYDTGCLLEFEWIEDKARVDRKDLKEAFAAFGVVKFVDYAETEESAAKGILRFKDALTEEILKTHAPELKFKVAGKEVRVRLLEGEEEAKYMEIVKSKASSAPPKKGKFGRPGKRRAGR